MTPMSYRRNFTQDFRANTEQIQAAVHPSVISDAGRNPCLWTPPVGSLGIIIRLTFHYGIQRAEPRPR